MGDLCSSYVIWILLSSCFVFQFIGDCLFVTVTATIFEMHGCCSYPVALPLDMKQLAKFTMICYRFRVHRALSGVLEERNLCYYRVRRTWIFFNKVTYLHQIAALLHGPERVA